MAERREAVAALEERLGYEFKDRVRLETALTHSSVGEGAKKVADNELLEFLGDRVLGLIAAQALIQRYPDATEGDLAPRFNGLVSRETCAEVARSLGVGPALRMSGSATKMGVRERGSVLAGACEALMAAVYLEAGLEKTRDLFVPLWRDAFTTFGQRGRDSKTRLQEWAQGQGKPLPVYELSGRTGADHAPTFTMEVRVDGLAPASAQGRSRQEAEKAAAQSLLEREGVI